MREVDIAITLIPGGSYTLAEGADSVKLTCEHLDDIVVWQNHLRIPSDREIACGVITLPLVITNKGNVERTVIFHYKYDRWTRMQLSEIKFHDGIYYERGCIDDFIY